MMGNLVKRLRVSLAWRPGEQIPVGRFAQTGSGQILFECDREFLRAPLPLSPFKLDPSEGATLPNSPASYEGLFGVFSDSLPDGWGHLVMARAMQKKGLRIEESSPLDRLAFLGTRCMGALVYEPEINDGDKGTFVADLATLNQECGKILEGSSEDVLAEIIKLGGSPGGARPKVLVGIEAGSHTADEHQGQIIAGHTDMPSDAWEHWLVKFRSTDDDVESSIEEFLYCKVARIVGLAVEPHLLFRDAIGNTWFGVRRFDRKPGNRRLHLHTLAGLLHADFRVPSLDYHHLMRVTQVLTRSVAEVEKAFRLAVFNVRFHNRDDHGKNFSFLMDEYGKWTLAPAYDLTWSAGPGGEHTTTICGEGRNPGLSNLLDLANKSGISSSRANEIIEEVDAGNDILISDARGFGLKKLLSRFEP